MRCSDLGFLSSPTSRALKMTTGVRGERVALLSKSCSSLFCRPQKSVGGVRVCVPQYWTELKASGKRETFLKRSNNSRSTDSCELPKTKHKDASLKCMTTVLVPFQHRNKTQAPRLTTISINCFFPFLQSNRLSVIKHLIRLALCWDVMWALQWLFKIVLATALLHVLFFRCFIEPIVYFSSWLSSSAPLLYFSTFIFLYFLSTVHIFTQARWMEHGIWYSGNYAMWPLLCHL